MPDTKLIDAAKKAYSFAYSPYSGYRVGAAILGENEKIYDGCNVENVSFGATICAERSAIVQMVSEHCRVIKEVVIYSKDGGKPCGICRQVLSEFIPDKTKVMVHCVDVNEKVHSYTFNELFPDAFNSESIIRQEEL